MKTAHALGHTGTILTQIPNILITGKFELDRLEVVPDPKSIEDQESRIYQVSNAICVAAAQLRIIVDHTGHFMTKYVHQYEHAKSSHITIRAPIYE